MTVCWAANAIHRRGQVTVAPVVVMPELVTAEMTGGVVSAGSEVLKVKSPEVARLPAASLESTRKWYVVPAVKPLSAWEWELVMVALMAVELP